MKAWMITYTNGDLTGHFEMRSADKPSTADASTALVSRLEDAHVPVMFSDSRAGGDARLATQRNLKTVGYEIADIHEVPAPF